MRRLTRYQQKWLTNHGDRTAVDITWYEYKPYITMSVKGFPVLYEVPDKVEAKELHYTQDRHDEM